MIKQDGFSQKWIEDLSIISRTLLKVGTLGKEIKISPKAYINFNAPGFTVGYLNVETIQIPIKIGELYTADLIMSVEAYNALNNNADINIITLKEFKENFFNKPNLKNKENE